MPQKKLDDVHGKIKWDAASVAIGLLSRKWVILIIRELARRPLRHNELRRALDNSVTDKALARALRSMVECHVVTREVTDTAPPGVRYDLAPLGRSLLSVIHAIGQRWVDQQPTHQSWPTAR
jgi:DNA-binding HxlR family transcriptional regulator